MSDKVIEIPVNSGVDAPRGFASEDADPQHDESARPAMLSSPTFGKITTRAAGEEKIKGIIGQIIEDAKSDREIDTSTFATFVSMRGSRHQIILEPMEMLQVVAANIRGLAPSMRFNPKSGKKIPFIDGMYFTDNLDEIEALLNPDFGFMSEYDIAPDDPTGFWERIGYVQAEIVPTRVVKTRSLGDAVQIFKGSLTHDAADPAMRS